MSIRVQREDFDASTEARALTDGRADVGAVVTFVGLCRDEGGRLAALEIDKPILIGHSDGGSIALICAGAHPGVPLGVAVMAPHEFVEEETLAGIRAARKLWEETDWPHRLGRHHRDPQRVFSDWNDCWLSPAFRNWNIEDCLPNIRCPVLAIQGEDDEYATMRQIEAIAAAVPGTQLLKLARCGHSPQRDQESAVLDALDAFIRRASGS